MLWLINTLLTWGLNCIELTQMFIEWLVCKLVHLLRCINCSWWLSLLMNVGMCITLIAIDCVVKCFICHINYFGEITLALLLLSMHILWPFVHHSKLVLDLLAVLILSWHVLFLSELWIEFCWWMWPILILGLFIIWNRLDTMLVRLIALAYIVTPSYLRSEIVTLLVFASLFCLLNIWVFCRKQIAWGWYMVLTWNSCHVAFVHLTNFLHDSCSS